MMMPKAASIMPPISITMLRGAASGPRRMPVTTSAAPARAARIPTVTKPIIARPSHYVGLGLARVVVEPAQCVDADDHRDHQQDHRALVAVAVPVRRLAAVEDHPGDEQQHGRDKLDHPASGHRSDHQESSPLPPPGRGGWHNPRSLWRCGRHRHGRRRSGAARCPRARRAGSWRRSRSACPVRR